MSTCYDIDACPDCGQDRGPGADTEGGCCCCPVRPSRATRRTARYGGAGLTADSRIITLRQGRDDATPARTARAKRVRERRQAIRDARRASR